jgi:hypothetical protein
MKENINEPKKMFTPQTLDVSTTFYLEVQFSGHFDEGCGLTFSLLDHEEIFTFGIFAYDFCYKKQLIQNSRLNGKWKLTTFENIAIPLPDLKLYNEIVVLVTGKQYELTINGKEIEPKIEVDIERLRNFKGINIDEQGNCFKVDPRKSSVANRGKDNRPSGYSLKHLNLSHI